MNKQTIITALMLFTVMFPSVAQEGKGGLSYFVRQGRFVSLAEIGILRGNPNDEIHPTLHYGLNYSIINHLSVGLGVGVEHYQEAFIPVSANLTWRFGNRRVIPFVTLQAGYMVGLEDKRTPQYGYYDPYWYNYGYYNSMPYTNPDPERSEGGWMYNPQFGIIILATKDFGITVAAGYRHHSLRYVSDGKPYYSDTYFYNRLSFRVGVTF
ncbi:MAG: hypothetical protein LBC81_06165 [Tannerellaceae bacterium]|nr:hypothetical protein [Tannerellaceae bacterium]